MSSSADAAASTAVPLAPGHVSRAFARALELGDLKAATTALTRDACFLTRDATAINGREQIRAVLAQLIARRPRFHVVPHGLLSFGDLVLASERWEINFQAEGAAPLRESTSATLLLRRVDSEWKLALLAPWGWQ